MMVLKRIFFLNLFFLLLFFSKLEAVENNSYSKFFSQKEYFYNYFSQVLSQIKSMPITLFPGKGERQLVLLRRGFKKHYFQKPEVGEIVFLPHREAKIYLKRFFVRKFPFKEAYFLLKNYHLDSDGRIYWENLYFYLWIDLDEVSDYVYRECIRYGISWPSFRIVGSEIEIKGKLKVIGLNFRVKGRGEFQISPDKENVYFRANYGQIGFMPLPSFALASFMKRFNPLFKIERLPLNFKLDDFIYQKNMIGLKLQGEAKLRRK